MGVIDIHAHAFPDKLAQRAMPALETEANWEAVLDGRLKSLLKSMDKADVRGLLHRHQARSGGGHLSVVL